MDEHYSNCLFGALVLMVRHRSWRLRMIWRRRRVIPHFFVATKDGDWHFHIVKDLLPWPFRGLWFRGRYDRLKRRVRLKGKRT
jgi:hypothetical protein